MVTTLAPSRGSALGLLDAGTRACSPRPAATDDPGERFRLAHLSALRTAAAVSAQRGPPGERPRRLMSVWVLLERVAPEYAEWAAYFAAGAPVRAAIEAGALSAVTPRAADDQLRAADRVPGPGRGLARAARRLTRTRSPAGRAAVRIPVWPAVRGRSAGHPGFAARPDAPMSVPRSSVGSVTGVVRVADVHTDGGRADPARPATGRVALVIGLLLDALDLGPGQPDPARRPGARLRRRQRRVRRAARSWPGADVTVVDISADALATLRRRADEAGVSARVHGLSGRRRDGSATLVDGRPVRRSCWPTGCWTPSTPSAPTFDAMAAATTPGGLLSVLVGNPLRRRAGPGRGRRAGPGAGRVARRSNSGASRRRPGRRRRACASGPGCTSGAGTASGSSPTSCPARAARHPRRARGARRTRRRGRRPGTVRRARRRASTCSPADPAA